MSDYPSMSHVQHITFEGNDCVVMSPEEYGAALADLEAKDYELSTLRAELTEARRQLKEAREQKPVAYCFASEIAQFNDEQFRIAQMHNRKCSNAEIALYTRAPVPQPAVPEAVAKDATVGAAIERAARDLPPWCAIEVKVEGGSATVYAYDGYGEEVKTESSGEKTLAEEIDSAVAAILSATDSEVKK